MTMRSWLRPLCTRPATRAIPRERRRTRLGVELLEDRWVPSTFTVLNTLDNTSPGSLRWAVGQANSHPGADTIAFDGSAFATAKTITLTSGQLDLTDSDTTTICGPAAGVTVSGNQSSRVFDIDSGTSAALSKLIITGGSVSDNGGGLTNSGTVTLTDCAISGNSAALGGGLMNYAMATLTGCTISGNSVVGDPNDNAAGGGLMNSGTVTLIDCTISGNSAVGAPWSGANGGGLGNHGTAILTGCTISGNSANTTTNYIYSSGGGMVNFADGTATLSNCTVSGNSANSAGGLEIDGTTALSDCTISGNSGGGLADSYATATMTDCTVSGNSVDGGVINFSGAATLTNCTISGNSGGGLGNYGSGTLTLTNCTISGNSNSYGGGGLANASTATLTNTIVAGNGSTDVSNGGGSISGSNDLIGTGDAGGLVNGVDGNIVGVADPLLAPLGNYGGTTQTMPLLPGSPALDAGTDGDGVPATDQRGEGRYVGIDIGAFESQGFTLTPVTGNSPQTANIGTAFASPLAVSVTANNPNEPIQGGVVNFVPAPSADGATAMFQDSSVALVNGLASVIAAPNNVLGRYTVGAASPGSSVSFALTNAGNVLSSLVVNTTSDSIAPGAGLLSLREAIAFADTSPSGSTAITFDPTVFASPRTINLTGPEFELTSASGTVTITGPAVGVTIEAGGTSRVFQIDAGVTASFSDLTITGGSAAMAEAWPMMAPLRSRTAPSAATPPASMAAACSTAARPR